jgi:hypothetical protein
MLEIVPITSGSRVTLPGFVVTPEMYAHVLFILTNGSRGYIAELWWKSGVGRRKRESTALCGAETPLARKGDGGNYELLVPDSNTLRSIWLAIFYRDDSAVTISLGSGDRVIVVRRGANGEALEAQERIKQAQTVLETRKTHPDIIIAGAGIALLLVVAAISFAVGNRWVGLVMATLSVTAGYIAVKWRADGYLRPRPSRIGAGWSAMGWGRDDLRSYIKDVAVILTGIALGFWFGTR